MRMSIREKVSHFVLTIIAALLFSTQVYAEVASNLTKYFRDDFPGTAIRTDYWSLPTLTGAAGYSVSGNNLVVTLTTGATDSFTLTSKDPITLPARASFGITTSARSANQNVYLRLASKSYVDSGGTSGHMAQWDFNGTTATVGNTQTSNFGYAGTSTARSSLTATTTAMIYQIYASVDDVRFAQVTPDSTATKVGMFVHNAKIPDVREQYYLQIVAKNTGASTALTLTVDFAHAQGYQEMVMDANHVGDTGAGMSIPVTVTSSAVLGSLQSVTGQAAHDAVVSGNPVRVGARAVSANYAAVASGDVADNISTLVGAQIAKPYSIPEADFHALDQITNTATAQQAKAATAGQKNYVTRLVFSHGTLAAAGEIQVRSTPIASTTATIASNTLVMAGTYNWKVGDMVYVTASTVTGLTAANYYYILTVSGANLTFAATRGGTTLAISGTSVAATLAKIMYRHQMQTAVLPVSQVQFDNPVDGGTGLAIEVVTPVAIATGRVDWNMAGYVAP